MVNRSIEMIMMMMIIVVMMQTERGINIVRQKGGRVRKSGRPISPFRRMRGGDSLNMESMRVA